eukprot:PhM_4_TR17931/c0_g1_i1/m.13966
MDDAQIPSREHIGKLQMLRTTLVRLLTVGEQLDDIVNGCLVRVLLEIKGGEAVENASNDYHVAVLKGVKKGMAYSGFTWDHIQTDVHFVIELPPVVRTTPHGNHVQLNSISNSPIREAEYQLWVQQMVASHALIITPSQVDLRVQLLENQMRALGVAAGNKAKRRKTDKRAPVDPSVRRQQRQWYDETKARYLREFEARHHLLPSHRDLLKLTREQSVDLEKRMVDTLASLREALTEKSKCRLCRTEKCVVICYPCKHQVMCEGCSASVSVCPAPSCGAPIEDKIMPYSA